MVLFLLVVRLNTLPGQISLQQLDQHIADCLQVVASRLLDAQMRVDGGVTRRTRQIFVFTLRNVLLAGLGVAVLLRQTEID